MSEDKDKNDETENSYETRLYPKDQARVDEFIKTGVNSVERKPFRPLRLIIMLIVVVTLLSLLSQGLARWSGIY
ncbi:MAG: DUF3094 family protein [Pseudomonadota bacterium]